MKIERISSHQIKCTLTRGDLIKRHLTFRKLVGGGPEIRELLREMSERSFEETGMELHGHLMIEAVSQRQGDVEMVITCVDQKDLPVQPPLQEETDEEKEKKLSDALKLIMGMAAETQNRENEKTPEEETAPLLAVFAFPNAQELRQVARLPRVPRGIRSDLFRAGNTGYYYLAVQSARPAREKMVSYSMLLTEFARTVDADQGTLAYFREHYETVFRKNALDRIREEGLPETAGKAEIR